MTHYNARSIIFAGQCHPVASKGDFTLHRDDIVTSDFRQKNRFLKILYKLLCGNLCFILRSAHTVMMHRMVSAVTDFTYDSIGIGFYFLLYNIIYRGIYLLINIAVHNLLTARLITRPTTAPNFFWKPWFTLLRRCVKYKAGFPLHLVATSRLVIRFCIIYILIRIYQNICNTLIIINMLNTIPMTYSVATGN